MSKRDSAEFKISDPKEMAIGALPPLDRHPGCWVRDVLLPEYGLSISELARHLSLNRANLSEVLSGKREVSRELCYALGALMNDQVCDLLLAYQHAWSIEQERGRRAVYRAAISRLEPVTGASA